MYGALNMHVEPSRTSTSFYQINEGVRVDVLRHEVAGENRGCRAKPQR